MKRSIGRIISSSIVFAALTIGTSLVASAQNDQGGGRLAGTWDAAVTIRDCATGNAIRTFASIANFSRDGGFLGSTSGQPQASRTPEHGVWRHVAGNQYEFKFKSFNFDAGGNATGYVIVRHDLELNEKGDAYTSGGEARIYLLNGTQVAVGCSSGIGSRFEF